jgi:hypothetical protein
MSTKFNVSLNNEQYVVAVNKSNFEALAVLLVECLKHFAQMSHKAAVDLYTTSTKQCRDNSFSIKNKHVDISISANNNSAVADVTFDAVKMSL